MSELEVYAIDRIYLLEKQLDDAHVFLDTRNVPRRRSMDEPTLKLWERIALMVGQLPSAAEKEAKEQDDAIRSAMQAMLDDEHG